MELKDFVSQTLVQIVEGVSLAQQEVSKGQGGSHSPATISPRVTSNYDWASQHGYVRAIDGRLAQIVKFDVALTVSNETEGKGGVGVFSGAFQLGGSGSKSAGDTSLTRVQFSVPLTLPDTDQE